MLRDEILVASERRAIREESRQTGRGDGGRHLHVRAGEQGPQLVLAGRGGHRVEMSQSGGDDGRRSGRLVRRRGRRARGIGDAVADRWPGGGARVQLGVLALAMAPQIDFALESAAAVVARERLVPRVLPGVGDQVGRLAESFAADRALVRLFTCPT